MIRQVTLRETTQTDNESKIDKTTIRKENYERK